MRFLRRHFYSFIFAINGLKKALSSWSNLWVELLAAILVFFFGIIFNIPKVEWLIVIWCIGLVISLELMNSAIEVVLDFLHKEHHEDIKKAKDIAAGAVLVAALTSAVIGLLIFGPRLVG